MQVAVMGVRNVRYYGAYSNAHHGIARRREVLRITGACVMNPTTRIR
jgi:hypothetical protein